MRQQFQRSALPGRQTDRSHRLAVLRHAFVNAAGALTRRPEPRAAFDNAARRDNPYSPWEKFAEPMRACVVAALAEGGPTVEETETRVTHAVLALLEYILEPLHPSQASDVLYLNVVREEAEALEAQSLAQATPTADRLARAMEITERAISGEQLYCAMMAEAVESTQLRIHR